LPDAQIFFGMQGLPRSRFPEFSVCINCYPPRLLAEAIPKRLLLFYIIVSALYGCLEQLGVI